MTREIYLLAGDIGGTKTDMAVYSFRGGPHIPIVKTTVRSADYPNLESAASEFLEDVGMEVQAARRGRSG